MRLAWLLGALVLAALLAYLQQEALQNLWYWRFPWFDTLMHFLGGTTVAAFAVAILDMRRAYVFLGGMFAIAVGWELFELAIHQEREANFVFDTSLDLLMDTIGMTVAYLVARLTIWRSA